MLALERRRISGIVPSSAIYEFACLEPFHIWNAQWSALQLLCLVENFPSALKHCSKFEQNVPLRRLIEGSIKESVCFHTVLSLTCKIRTLTVPTSFYDASMSSFNGSVSYVPHRGQNHFKMALILEISGFEGRLCKCQTYKYRMFQGTR